MPVTLVVGPNKIAVTDAKRMGLVPQDAVHVTSPEHLRGYFEPVVYYVQYSPRPGSANYLWGSYTREKYKAQFDRELLVRRADIRPARLP
jgi:hypothetical protein